MDFVNVKDGKLCLAKRLFRFVGTNCYFFQEEAAREVMGWEGYSGRVEEALQKLSRLGLSVARAWACNDDPNNPAAMQLAPLRYNEFGLRGMDLVIATAARYNIKLILCLSNYWSDYGGVPQYCSWHGLSPQQPHRFFFEPAILDHFGQHIEHMLSRVNTYTGIPWGQDPTILAWELMNEPRGLGLEDQGETMTLWAGSMTQRVRRVAPQQLVSTGEEGFGDDLGAGDPGMHEPFPTWMSCGTGQDFAKTSQLVDIASIHLYPEHWGWDLSKVEEAGVHWILNRANVAQQLGKPLVIGEFGLQNNGSFDLGTRRRIYSTWVHAALGHPAVAGVLSWSFSTDDRPDAWDAYSWYLKAGTTPEDPANRYADLHQEWARRVHLQAKGCL